MKPHAEQTNSPQPIDPYFDTPRHELLEWAGIKPRRVVEVGCGTAANAAWLRAHGAEWIEGVEPHDASAKIAAGRLDRLHPTTIEMASLEGPFDVVICADVLEHLMDPEAALKKLRVVAAPHSVLVASVPNIRHYRALARIAFGRAFEPDASGTFDATHLRFFTRANLDSLLRRAGWSPVSWGGPTWSRRGRIVRPILAASTRGYSDEWLLGQWFVVAHRGVAV